MKLTVFATTDIHGAIYPYDYFGDTEKQVSLLHMKSYIERWKHDHPDDMIITADNGDMLQGDVWSDYDYKHAGDHLLVPDVINDMYDVIGIGNHEFNFGLDYLTAAYSIINTNIINANVDFKDRALKDLVQPYIILNKETPAGPLKIGFLSVVPTQIMKWDAFHLEGNIEVADMRKTVEHTAEKLKEVGADIVILLSHSGMSKNPEHIRRYGENQTLLMTMIKNIDGIVFGHTHEFFPDEDFEVEVENIDFKKGTVNGKPMVQPGVSASHLGMLSFEVEKVDDSWKIIDQQAQLIAAETIELDENIKKKYESHHEKIKTYLSHPIGAISEPWHTYFSRVFPSKAVQVVAEAGKAYTRELIDRGEIEDLPVLGFNAAIKAGRDGAHDFTVLEAGKITLSDAINIYKHANAMIIIKIDGRVLKEWLEWSASQFNMPRETDNLLKPNQSRDGFPSYNYDTFFDLEYTFDISQPPRYDSTARIINDSSRLTEVKFEGKPVRDTDVFIVPANNYRVAYTSFLRKAEIVHESQLNVRDIVIDYMAADPSFELKDPLTILPRQKYRMRTAAKAKEYITEDQPIRHLAESEDGYSWYEINLD